MHNKRGLSAIITTLLIVLLVLVAVGIVWGVVRGILRGGTEGIGSSARCLNIEVEATAINCNDPSACVVTLTRTGSDDDEIGGVKLVFFEGADNSGVIDVDDVPDLGGDIEKLAGKTITGIDSTLTSPDKVEVTVYLLDESGEEQLCSQTTPSSIGSGAGDNGGGEGTCDDGNCDAGECDSCPQDCTHVECCGDGICNNGETCETCPEDNCCVGDSCDGVWNPPEDAGVECDGGTGCTDCVCDVGYVPADPLGPNCEVSSAVNCNLVFEEGEQCDGGDDCILPGEPNECTCPEGYNPEGIYPEGNGGCILRVALVSGIVEDVWPGTSGMYFGSSDLPREIDYTGYYVSFLESLDETNCRLIANYVFPTTGYDKSHIAFNFETDVLVDYHYGIWGDSTCA